MKRLIKNQQNFGGYFDCDKKVKEKEELEKKQLEEGFWDNKELRESVFSKLSNINAILENIISYKGDTKNALDLIELLSLEPDNELEETLIKDYDKLKEEVEQFEIYLLFDNEYDANSCTIDIHSGAGGTEACDWAEMLYRMYLRYCERQGYKVTLYNYQAGEEAGIKSVCFKVDGSYAYGYLKEEKGVHRLVRLSPFDSSNRRHTSFASVDVTPEIDKNIDINIDEKDIRIDVYRSTGAGGQGVNTTDSAVRVTHLPTGIVVTCQNERSQIQNKETALQVLKSKLYVLEQQKKEQELAKEKGEQMNIEFGSQIRSYVMHPYSMVKDHRTSYETSNVTKVLDGDLTPFMEAYLKGAKNESQGNC